MKVLVVGSLNMDYTLYIDKFPKEGETIFGLSRFIQPGGKGANQAAAIAKSGLCECIFKGSLGDDNDGKTFLKTLKEIGIDTSHIKTSKKETGNATIIVDKRSENKIVILSGANGDLLENDIDEQLIASVDFVVLQNEIPQTTNELVMKLAHKHNVKVIYNPAPYRKINLETFKYVDYFIPNEVELKEYSGKENFDESIKHMLEIGVKNLIVTLGTKGSFFINKEKSFKIEAFKVKAIDTVAAGDTYVGYFTAGLASNKSIEEAMKFASKASSITVTRKGSIVSIPVGSEVIL